jgi:hypothetical protein
MLDNLRASLYTIPPNWGQMADYLEIVLAHDDLLTKFEPLHKEIQRASHHCLNL